MSGLDKASATGCDSLQTPSALGVIGLSAIAAADLALMISPPEGGLAADYVVGPAARVEWLGPIRVARVCTSLRLTAGLLHTAPIAPVDGRPLSGITPIRFSRPPSRIALDVKPASAAPITEATQDGPQNAMTACSIGTHPVIPAVYGVKAPL